MKTSYFLFFFLLFSTTLICQTTISGVVVNKKGIPVADANIYLEGTYDGSSSDEQGKFSFETSEKGIQTLIVSYITFEPFLLIAEVSKMNDLQITLQEDVNSLGTVMLSAGTFSTGNTSKMSVLKPLDIVTTASAVGDFVGALQTLPGTTTVAEDGRLFVRGGDAGETQIFVDGIRVFTPYTSTANNVPVRGRFNSFLFDGITFSTGGYSAEYGQALSSVLLLNTIDEPVQEKTDISVMSLGGELAHTKKWESSSLSLSASYINLTPYRAVFSDRNDWIKPFETASGEMVFRQKIGSGLLKLYSAFDNTQFEVKQEDINFPEGIGFTLNNQNFYTNVSFSDTWNRGWSVFAGGSYTYAKSKLRINEALIGDLENSGHLKLKVSKRFDNRFRMNFGIEQLVTDFDESYRDSSQTARLDFNNTIAAAFTEADWVFSRKIALKLGLRGDYCLLQDEGILSPRASFAYKTSKNGQLSLAYGDFFQQQDNGILKFNSKLESQHAQHYILNYQYAARNRIFHAELYRKNYNNLVVYEDSVLTPTTVFSAAGEGYAQGLDLFWRDNESVRNLDYWISYSFLDTERKYKDYPKEAVPPFVNRHNLSIVTKYWINKWKSQFGTSYQFASGRTYTDFNTPGFLQNKTKSYNDISLSWAYLLSQQKILFVSVSNVLGFKNVNGYQYANTPSPDGVFARREIQPSSDRFFFVGFFWTISSDGKANQLDNL